MADSMNVTAAATSPAATAGLDPVSPGEIGISATDFSKDAGRVNLHRCADHRIIASGGGSQSGNLGISVAEGAPKSRSQVYLSATKPKNTKAALMLTKATATTSESYPSR